MLASVAVLSHVLYHIPDHEWGTNVIRAANILSADGVLLVVLKDRFRLQPNAGRVRGAAVRLNWRTGAVTRRHKEFDFTFSHSPTPFTRARSRIR